MSRSRRRMRAAERHRDAQGLRGDQATAGSGRAEAGAGGRSGSDPLRSTRRRTRTLRHPLWIHTGVSERLRSDAALYARLGLLIEQLAARGRTSVIKGCRGGNKGWYRAPLGGGTGGLQRYLWWTTAGSRQGRECGLPPGAIAIRAARHHNDHRPLDPETTRAYRRIETAAAIDESVAGKPWTDAQARFRDGTEPVRVLEGHPGSGKTTALWHSVDAREDEHVLYVTWSPALADDARAHFECFAAPGIKTTCTDFAGLLAAINDEPAVRTSLRESREEFSLAVRKGQRVAEEPVDGRSGDDACRASVNGPGQRDRGGRLGLRDGGVLRLTDRAYRRHRRRVRRIEDHSMDSLQAAISKLPAGTLAAAFPELVRARKALERLADNGAPAALVDVDRIVVDEAQDLTLTELSVVAELCRAIGGAGKGWPKLLMAGDEGQTVRPTGFSWRRTRELLHARVGRPATYILDGQVRCPKRIAQAAAAVTRYYKDLEKETRPGGQHDATAGTAATEGEVLCVNAGDECYGLIRQLTENPSVTVISALDRIPEWVPEDVAHHVLTPAEAKGLEYQKVCVVRLRAGCITAILGGRKRSSDARLDEELRRSAMDQVRVAMTRSTETLVTINAHESDLHQSGVHVVIAFGPRDTGPAGRRAPSRTTRPACGSRWWKRNRGARRTRCRTCTAGRGAVR